MTTRVPCNHKTRGRFGMVVYTHTTRLGPVIWWCVNCGAIESGTGWRYPKRAYAAPKKRKQGAK